MRETWLGRGLAAALLAGALALAWLQARSPLAQSLAQGRPVLGWLRFEGPEPRLFLTVYQPSRRTLDLVYVEAGPRGKEGAAAARLGALSPSAGIREDLPSWSAAWEGAGPEPPLDAADWFRRQARRPGAWLKGRFSQPLFDRLLLALEYQRLGPDDLRPAWLPPDAQAAALLGRLILGEEGLPAPERITVEVLNATGMSGVASRAKNVLRLRGADVMSVGNVGGQRRTVVYDRTGRFENAAAVRRMLGCPQGRAETQVDLKRLVDVSVVLAEDCPLP